jgi:prolipoprotein diacylglyceryltransferase
MNLATLAFWVHDLDPVAIHFPPSWGLRGVHWYGLAYAAGFLVAAWLLGRWRRQGLAPARRVLAPLAHFQHNFRKNPK